MKSAYAEIHTQVRTQIKIQTDKDKSLLTRTKIKLSL